MEDVHTVSENILHCIKILIKSTKTTLTPCSVVDCPSFPLSNFFLTPSQSDNSPADRFDFIMQKFKEMAGDEYLGFCNAT